VDEIAIGTKVVCAKNVNCGGEEAFMKGEQVIIEKISPLADNLEFKYVVTSSRLGRKFRFREVDFLLQATETVSIGEDVAFNTGDIVIVEKIKPDKKNPESKYVVMSQLLNRRIRIDGDSLTVAPPECIVPLPALDSTKNLKIRILFSPVSYLGGLPDDPHMGNRKGHIIADEEKMWLALVGEKKLVIQWADCTGVTVDGGEVAKRKVGAVLAFGVLGGLAGKGGVDRAFLSIHRKDGAVAYFQIDKQSPQGVRAKLTPLLLQVGVPFLDDPAASHMTAPAPATQISVADELAKLAALRDSGVLSDEEFAAQKAKLLG
jgi:Short C-terminal domain